MLTTQPTQNSLPMFVAFLDLIPVIGSTVGGAVVTLVAGGDPGRRGRPAAAARNRDPAARHKLIRCFRVLELNRASVDPNR
jgi:hypothetical protein